MGSILSCLNLGTNSLSSHHKLDESLIHPGSLGSSAVSYRSGSRDIQVVHLTDSEIGPITDESRLYVPPSPQVVTA